MLFPTEKRSTPASQFILIDTDITINATPFAVAFWLENEHWAVNVWCILRSQVISSNESLFHSHVRMWRRKGSGKCSPKQNCSIGMPKIIISSNKIKWKSKNDCFWIWCQYKCLFRLRNKFNIPFVWVWVWMWILFRSFATAHQRFSFSFYVIWFPIGNQRVIDTHTIQRANPLTSYQIKVRQFSFLFINVLLSGIWNREKTNQKELLRERERDGKNK